MTTVLDRQLEDADLPNRPPARGSWPTHVDRAVGVVGVGIRRPAVGDSYVGRIRDLRGVGGASELLLLPMLYGRPLTDLLPTEPVALTEAASVSALGLRRQLTEPPRLRQWRLPRLKRAVDDGIERMRPVLARTEARFPDVGVWRVMEAASDGWDDEATGKAARRLRADRQDIAVAAQELWGRSLAAERDRRLGAGARGPDDTTRGRQARRGHITRALLVELRPTVEAIQQARQASGADG